MVASWRPDINVLGHTVLQYLYEYALDRNELSPSLAISREWIDDTTLELKLRQGVRFHNGESFDANAVKFNFEYQRLGDDRDLDGTDTQDPEHWQVTTSLDWTFWEWGKWRYVLAKTRFASARPRMASFRSGMRWYSR